MSPCMYPLPKKVPLINRSNNDQEMTMMPIIIMLIRQAPTPWTELRISTQCKSTLERFSHHQNENHQKDDDDVHYDDD